MHRLHPLPFNISISSLDILKKLSEANIHLGELKGVLSIIPNPQIILRIVNIGEAKASSEIDNIKTTIDEILKSSISTLKTHSKNAKGVTRYLRATNILFRDISINNEIKIPYLDSIQGLLEPENEGYRKLPGLKIYNKKTKEVIHVPPQDEKIIKEYYKNLEYYINHNLDEYDPLIKMALVHYQFECIHPYKDANGRVGRILNIVYLVNKHRLNYPILNISKYINETKQEYYALLKKCHNDINYIDEFVSYILKGVIETAKYTINLILQINRLITKTNEAIKKELPAIYSEELVVHIYRHMYTKNTLFRNTLNLSRTTSTTYLKKLVAKGFLDEEKVGKEVIYKNSEIKNIFQ